MYKLQDVGALGDDRHEIRVLVKEPARSIDVSEKSVPHDGRRGISMRRQPMCQSHWHMLSDTAYALPGRGAACVFHGAQMCCQDVEDEDVVPTPFAPLLDT